MPEPVESQPVVERTVRILSMSDEGQVSLRQSGQAGVRFGFPADDEQAARDVVEAVSVLPARHRTAGVLEQTGVVAEPAQVREGELQFHAAAGTGMASSDVAKAR